MSFLLIRVAPKELGIKSTGLNPHINTVMRWGIPLLAEPVKSIK
jgi:hypothetical protein